MQLLPRCGFGDWFSTTTVFRRRELHCLGRVVHWLMSIFAWPESPFCVPRTSVLGYHRPPLRGWCLGELPLFMYPVCSIDWSLRIEPLETMVLDSLLRELAPRTLSASLCWCRDEASGLRRIAMRLWSFPPLDRRVGPSSLGRPVELSLNLFLALSWLGGGCGSSGQATFWSRECCGWLQARGPAFVGRAHGDVYVFKNQAWRDAPAAVGGLNQIVAGLSAMLAAECVDEEKGLGKLPGFDQETSAIDFPCSRRFSHVHLPFGGRENEKAFSFSDCRFSISALSSSASLPEA